MPLTRRLKINLAFGIALLILVAGAAISYQSIRSLRSQQFLVVRAESVLRALSSMGENLKDAEASQRGYLLTARPDFLSAYHAAVVAADSDLEALEGLLLEGTQRENLARLRESVRRRVEVMESVLAVAATGDAERAEEMVRTGPGTALMEGVKRELATMERREFALLEERRREEARIAGGTVGVILFAGLLAMTMVVVSRQGIVNELLAREKAERTLAAQQASVRLLYDIAASQSLDYDQKIAAFLKMGTQRLGVSTGVLARIDDDLYEVVAVEGADEGIRPGDVFPLGQTYCSTVARDMDLKSWEHASEQGMKLEPCFNRFRLETYIGVPVLVNGKLYGAFSFSDDRPRDRPFTGADKDFLWLTSQWVAGEISQRETERALREGEQRYRRLAEASLESLVLTQDGRIIDANKAYCDMVRLSLEEVIGRNPLDFIAPESLPVIEDALRSGSEAPYEVVGVHPDGTRYFLEARGRATTFAGRPARITAVRDVTSRREAEQRIRESEERNRRLAEASLEGLILSQEGVIVDANRAYGEIIGVPVTELIGQPALRYVAPESVERVAEAIRTSFEEPYEMVALRSDGSRLYCEARGRATFHKGGPARITAIRDITQRRHAEQAVRESEERYRSLVEAASDIIYRTDTYGHFLYVNPTAVQIMGYPEEELLGTRYLDLIREDARESVAEFYWDQVSRELPTSYLEFPAITADGREVWIGQNVRLIHEGGELVGFQAVARDISRQREIEQMKDEFLSVVSHELRTPLTAIRGSLGLLVSGKMGSLDERGQRMLEIAAQNTDRLVRLINDLLDFEKIQSGRASMERRPVQAVDLVRRATEVMGPMAEKAGVRLVAEAPQVEISADPDRMDQVLTNLLSNAIKFSSEGGTIWVGGERRDRELVLWVRDEGRGVPADKLELIFERFQQVDSSDARQKGGTGLGLPIARSIVQQHGGRLWAESRWGEGSTFFLSLPLPSTHTAPDGERLALVCDDDEGVGAFVVAVLRMEGFEVLRAATGEEGLRLARERRPAVLLLDLVLPAMSGQEVLAELRRDPLTETIPVVILTGAEDDHGLDLGSIIGWVEKPIDRGELLRTVEWATSRKKEHCNVLVVEDDEDLARVISESLLARGHTSCRARTGREAIEMSRRLSYELLLLDPGLPDIDGFGLVDWLRRHNRHRNVPVLVYTARELEESERERLRLGRTEFLVKTRVTLEALEARITDMLGSAAEQTSTPQ